MFGEGSNERRVCVRDGDHPASLLSVLRCGHLPTLLLRAGARLFRMCLAPSCLNLGRRGAPSRVVCVLIAAASVGAASAVVPIRARARCVEFQSLGVGRPGWHTDIASAQCSHVQSNNMCRYDFALPSGFVAAGCARISLRHRSLRLECSVPSGCSGVLCCPRSASCSTYSASGFVADSSILLGVVHAGSGDRFLQGVAGCRVSGGG